MDLTELSNVTPEQLEEKLVPLFESAKNSLLISSNFHPDFYNRPKIRKAVENCIAKVEFCRILLDSEIDWIEQKKQLIWLTDVITKKKFPIKQSDKPLLHWIIIDGKNVRLEQPHIKNPPTTSNVIMYDVSKPVADLLTVKFNEWWNSAVAVQPNGSNQ